MAANVFRRVCAACKDAMMRRSHPAIERSGPIRCGTPYIWLGRAPQPDAPADVYVAPRSKRRRPTYIRDDGR